MRDLMRKGFAIFILTAYLLTACVIGRDTSPSDSAALESKTWVLISYGEEGGLQALLEGVEITATFIPGEAAVRGSSGCNHYFGDYEVTGNELSVSNIAFTEMACLTPEGVMEQEQVFLSMLAAAESFQVHGKQLTISSAGDQILKFE
jgi:heat shock protein HslJ